MAKNLYLNIDDDVHKAIRKIQAHPGPDLTLVLPKGSLLFSNSVNAKLLHKEADLLGKRISIITNDQKIQGIAQQEGFELKSFEALKTHGPSMDVRQKKGKAPQPYEAPPVHHSRPTSKSLYDDLKIKPAAAEPAPIVEDEIEPDAQQFQASESAEPSVLQRASHGMAYAPVTADLPKYTRPKPKFQVEKPPKKKLSFFAKLLRSAIAIGLVILILLVTVILPEADITVYARVQPVVRDILVTVDKNARNPSTEQLTIPGTAIDEDQQISKQYTASGKINVGTQARGTVQIYNFLGATYKLGAATTYLQAGTKVYHFQNDITGIKPSKYISGTHTPDPASLIPPAAVIADQGGEDYNLPAGTMLEIHNQKIGNVPQKLYATVASPIANGNSRFSSVISADDLANARTDLSAAIYDAASKKYSSNGNTIILKNGSNVTLKNVTFDKAAGDQAQTFTGTATAHITALAFDQDILKNLVEQRINLTLDTSRYLVTGENEVLKADYKSVDLAAGTGVLSVHFESVIAAKIDTQGIAAKINGKNAFDLKELLLSNPDIDGVDITFKPFWVKSVPRLSGKVYVTSKLDTGNAAAGH